MIFWWWLATAVTNSGGDRIFPSSTGEKKKQHSHTVNHCWRPWRYDGASSNSSQASNCLATTLPGVPTSRLLYAMPAMSGRGVDGRQRWPASSSISFSLSRTNHRKWWCCFAEKKKDELYVGK
nr:hypothetical protein Itr_chr06CG13000 [Ipomoea trifida]GMD03743.1 hypothetical protein Iba_chr06aCG11790 [Ipomoea batatas]